jgi:hypothetical protein
VAYKKLGKTCELDQLLNAKITTVFIFAENKTELMFISHPQRVAKPNTLPLPEQGDPKILYIPIYNFFLLKETDRSGRGILIKGTVQRKLTWVKSGINR